MINISKNIIYKTLPRILKRNCFFMVGGFIMIVTFILNGPRMCLLQTVLKISSRLPPESYQKLSGLIHIKDIFRFFFIIEQAFIYSPEMHFSVFRKISHTIHHTIGVSNKYALHKLRLRIKDLFQANQ